MCLKMQQTRFQLKTTKLQDTHQIQQLKKNELIKLAKMNLASLKIVEATTRKNLKTSLQNCISSNKNILLRIQIQREEY